jgi:hypothetical protein
MANQTISTDSNHDDLVGRAAGEDITINSGAVLTIDSMPDLTSMGILGDITISDGTLHIDGSRTYEIAYSSGSGGPLPAVGVDISWDSGSETGKVIALNSGDATSGVMTITVYTGSVAPTTGGGDVITDGIWSADVDTSEIGFLIIYGEDQDWGSVDARSTLRITGAPYQVGTGTGADSQTITLPHRGHQPAILVETGSGTGVYQWWFRVNTTASTVFYDAIADFGNTYESGFVFSQTFGSTTVTFGTSTNGGVPPSGARMLIPNVHIGTTTVGSPTTEVNSATFAAHIGLISPNTNLNVEIDWLNGSSCYVDFRGTNNTTVSNSCWGLSTTTALIQKVNATVTLDNCAIVNGSTGLAGGYQPVAVLGVIDNVGGITMNDCLIYHGTNNNNTGAFVLTTMANIAFTGTCKIASAIQDENSTYAIRATTASNVTAEKLICLGGPLGVLTGSNGWEIDQLIYGVPPGRGVTEQNMVNAVIHTASKGLVVQSGLFATGGAKHGTSNIFVLTDSDDVTIRQFGLPTAKINGGARALSPINLAGITANCLFQRIYYTNINGTQFATMVNSCADITFENCGSDYNDEIELDSSRVIAKGIHGASGNPDSATGVEGDDINVLATIFLDYFKSDTTGAVGLIFQDRGQKHLGDVEIVSGTPIWNGLGDLLMRTSGDQVIYTYPYLIKGHTGFANLAIQTAGVNATTNHTWEYDIDTGSGFSGSWSTINGTNLSAETISAAGFGFKVRITCTATNTGNAIKGFAARTTTTLAAQEANFYPLGTVPVSITVKDINTGAIITGARVFLKVTAGPTIFNALTNGSGVVEDTGYEYVGDQTIEGVVRKGDSPFYKQSPISGTITSVGFETTIFLIPDE